MDISEVVLHTLNAFPYAVSMSVSLCSVQYWKHELHCSNIIWFGFLPTLVADNAREACTYLEGGHLIQAL